MNNDLTNKTALVTGATSGIGYQSALDLARAGAFIIGAGRDPARCQQARDSILSTAPHARVEYLCADFSSLQQVGELVQQVERLIIPIEGGKLDLLVNNAGLYSSAKKLTVDGFELTFAVNHLAPFLLTHLLLPALQRAPDARVLTVSSQSHYRVFQFPARPQNPRPYIGIWAYAVSKISNVLFSAEFNRRVKQPGLRAWAVDPGLVNTDIGRKDGGFLSSMVWRSRQKMGTSAEVPSCTILHLASTSLDKIAPCLYWKDSRPKTPSRLARDPKLAQDLWEQSCQLVKIDEYFSVI